MPINSSVRLCGAQARQNNHQPCRQPAMKNGRCRLHGGKSTGPKTQQGQNKSALANYKNGLYTEVAYAERMHIRMMMRWRNDLKDI